MEYDADVTNINAFIEEDPSLEGLTIEEIMLVTDGTVFNNAGQVHIKRVYTMMRRSTTLYEYLALSRNQLVGSVTHEQTNGNIADLATVMHLRIDTAGFMPSNKLNYSGNHDGPKPSVICDRSRRKCFFSAFYTATCATIRRLYDITAADCNAYAYGMSYSQSS